MNQRDKIKSLQGTYGGLWRYPEIKDYHFLVNPYFPPLAMQEEMKGLFYELISQYPSGLKVQNELASEMFGIVPDNNAG